MTEASQTSSPASTAGHAPGTVSWIDLATSDVDGALAFYGGLFGWEAGAPLPPEAGGYRMPLLNGSMVGGVGPQMAPGARPAWTMYFSVGDVDGVTAAVGGNGGAVLAGPMDVMDAVRMAVFADPAGAVFGVVQERGSQGMQAERVPGAYAWAELATTDLAGARHFYPAVLPGVTERRWDGEYEYHLLQAAGREVAGMFSMGTDPSMPPMWSVSFKVASLDDRLAVAQAAGAKLLMGPSTTPTVGAWAVLTDPQGAIFCLLQPEPRASS